MNTRRFALVLLKLMLACFTSLPAIAVAQVATDRLAWVNLLPGGGACDICREYPAGIAIWAFGYEIMLTEYGGDTAPSWSPDGTGIAFERAGEIMVINATGGTPVNITNDPANDGAPAWSPDGTRIAFLSDRDGQPSQLYLMNVDGSGVVRLTNGIPFRGRIAWSPDGTKFVFDCEVEAGNPDICSLRTDGTGFARLTTDPAYEFGAAWSPDGSRIAFSTNRFAGSCDPDDPYASVDPYELAIMNPDGTGISRVGPAGTPGTGPSWAPDGNRIVFTSLFTFNCFDFTPYVSQINTDGTFLASMGTGLAAAWGPAIAAPSSPLVALSPLSLRFSAQGVGTSSFGLATQLLNYGSSELTVSSIVASGDFAQTNTCNSTVAAGATCMIAVRFTPTASGARSGTVTITNNAPGSPHVVPLSGVASFPPIVSFTSNCIETACTFNGSASDPDGSIAGFFWNFGDLSGEAAGPTVSHTYGSGGTYTVSFQVVDDVGVAATQTKSVTVVRFMHVGDLDGTSATSQKNTWSATATVTIEDSSHNHVASALVNGNWTDGSSSACTTNASGYCAVSKSGISKKSASATFAISGVTRASMSYNATDNHDPDGDSNGTRITVMRP